MVDIQIVSDLHLESPKAYDVFNIIPKAPYLALLGDIGEAVRHRDDFIGFLTRQLQHFEAVFFVPGNHEAYGASWTKTLHVLKDFEEAQRGEQEQGKFILLDRNIYEVRGHESKKTIILGCSLFSYVPPDRAMRVEVGLQDFFQTDSWTVKSHNQAHARDLAWLNAEVERLEQDASVMKVVIFSHWSPTLDARGSDQRHINSPITSAFATDLSRQACSTSSKVVLWAFGHTHYNCDFTVMRDNTAPLWFYTNQRGYYFSQASGFDPERTIEL